MWEPVCFFGCVQKQNTKANVNKCKIYLSLQHYCIKSTVLQKSSGNFSGPKNRSLWPCFLAWCRLPSALSCISAECGSAMLGDVQRGTEWGNLMCLVSSSQLCSFRAGLDVCVRCCLVPRRHTLVCLDSHLLKGDNSTYCSMGCPGGNHGAVGYGSEGNYINRGVNLDA